jgi:polysaccharide chain length determinant protein (PEP-CTERM system associated)
MLPGKTYTLTDFALMAWRRRWLIVAPMIVGAYAGLIVSSQLHDIYQSEMLIQVVPQQVPNSYVQSTVTMRTVDRLNALSQQVLSRTALEALIEEMRLYSPERQRKGMQDIVEVMRDNIDVETVVTARAGEKGADAFYVRFKYPDREVATRVTSRLGELFINLNARDRGNLADATNEFLESQLAETRNKLEEQDRKLQDFRQRNAGRLPTQVNFNMQAIQTTQLAVQALVESLARDRDRKLMLERLYNDARTEDATATQPATLVSAPQRDPSSPAGQTVQEQLVAAREALARLEIRLTPEHPDVARARRSIQELEARAAEEAARLPKGSAPAAAATPQQAARAERLLQMRAEIESLDRQIAFKEPEEQRQRALLADYQSRIEAVPGVETEWTALTRDYDTLQEAYKDLLTKSEQSKVAADLERRQIGEQFRVLDPARLPLRPSGIVRLQVNAIGALGGLAIGVALAALLEFRDTTFRARDEVMQILELPVLALVPYVSVETDVRRRRRRRWLTSAAVATLVAVGTYGIWALRLWKHLR